MIKEMINVTIKEKKQESKLDMKLSENGLFRVIKHSDKHQTCKIKMKKFLILNMIRWSMNRPANMERVDEMVESLLEKKQPISFLFQCIYNFEENMFEIIDGLHRYHALKKMSELLENVESNNWFYHTTLLIELKYNCSRGEYIDWFEMINKCSPVLELYLHSHDEKKEIVEEVVNIYYSKYTKHFKGLRPNIGNTSKENFTELISYMYEHFHITIENKKAILKVLEDINKNILDIVSSNNPKRFNSKITETSMKKCYETGLYLFLASKEKLILMITEYKL